MKVRNMPERVELRRANAAHRAGVVVSHILPDTCEVLDINVRKGRNKRAKVARKFMGPRVDHVLGKSLPASLIGIGAAK